MFVARDRTIVRTQAELARPDGFGRSKATAPLKQARKSWFIPGQTTTSQTGSVSPTSIDYYARVRLTPGACISEVRAMSAVAELERVVPIPEVAEACGVSPIVIFRTCAKHGVPVTRFNRHRAGLTMQNYAELLKRTSQPAKVLA